MQCKHETVKCTCCGLEASPAAFMKLGKKSAMTDAERLQRSNAGKLRWKNKKEKESTE